METRKTVFVSYAHEDRTWVDELSKHLAPWIRDHRINLWDDSRIEPGSNWLSEIERALEEAKIAVLFVSKDFLASDFIVNNELPTIVKRAEEGNLRLIWISISFAAYKETILSTFQSANDPEKPIESLSKPERDQTFVQVASSIANSCTIGSFAKSLRIIDETTEPIEAYLEGRQEQKERSFGVQARYEAEHDRISFKGANEVISYADIKLLPEEDQEFIADYEDALERNYQRWRKVRIGLGDAAGALDDEIQQQLNRIVKLICTDLSHIVDFLRKMHKYELDDHYGRYRYLCEQIK